VNTERWHAGNPGVNPSQEKGSVYDENGLLVAIVIGQDDDDSDTHLIAAAPAMLAALIKLAEYMEGQEDRPAIRLRRILAAAIDSAEGR
jgi:hypothetical protein